MTARPSSRLAQPVDVAELERAHAALAQCAAAAQEEMAWPEEDVTAIAQMLAETDRKYAHVMGLLQKVSAALRDCNSDEVR